MADAIDRFKAGDGRIDVCTFQSVSNVILPQIVRRLKDDHPRCDIRLFEREANPPRVNDYDLTFFDGPVKGVVEHLKLLDGPYLLVARPGDFPDGPVALSRLDGAPMVAYPPVCDQARVEETFARDGIRPHIVFRTVGNEAALSMVRAGMGSAVLPRLALHGACADPTLHIHKLRPLLPHAWSSCSGGPEAPTRHSLREPSRSPSTSKPNSPRCCGLTRISQRRQR
jgi:DNA-binding transcriptional LysR family regulator